MVAFGLVVVFILLGWVCLISSLVVFMYYVGWVVVVVVVFWCYLWGCLIGLLFLLGIYCYY